LKSAFSNFFSKATLAIVTFGIENKLDKFKSKEVNLLEFKSLGCKL
jgi:hypothetical protein